MQILFGTEEFGTKFLSSKIKSANFDSSVTNIDRIQLIHDWYRLEDHK
jgi:hypothetical protein